MKKITTLLMLSATLAMQSTAHAAQREINSGVILGINGGYARIQSPNSNIPDTTSPSHKNFHGAYGGQLGYQLALDPTAWVSATLGYDRGGQSQYDATINGTQSTVSIQQQNIDFLLGVGFVADGGFNLFAQGGLAYVTQKTSGVSSDLSSDFTAGNGTRHQGRPKVRLGLGYLFTQNLNVTLLYSHLFGNSFPKFPFNNHSIMSADSVQIGLTYTFPVG